MPWDTWYDLSVRELSERTDPAKEKLSEAEETDAATPASAETEGEDEQTTA
jgi:hypothetical protein